MIKTLRNSLLTAFAAGAFACPALATKQIVTVQNYSFAPASFSICLGDTVEWSYVNGSHTTTSGTIPAGATSWNSNMTSASTVFDYVPTVGGTYNYYCIPHQSSGMTAAFTVNTGTPPATPAITPASGSACPSSPVTLSTTQVANVTYKWYLNGTLASGSSTSNSYVATQGGSYAVKATLGCGTSTSTAVNIMQAPGPTQPTVTPTSGTACAAAGLLLTGTSQANTTHQWYLNGIAISGQGSTTTSFSATTSGSYTLKDSNLCGSATSAPVIVTIIPTPVPAFTVSHIGLAYTFTNTTVGTGYTYQWTFSDGSPMQTTTNATRTFATAGAYNVTLKATTATNSCVGNITQSIQATTSVVTIGGKSDVIIAPNPATSEITVTSSNAALTVSLYDNTGRIVKAENLAQRNGNKLTLNVADLPSGLYMLHLKSGNDVAVEKISVAH